MLLCLYRLLSAAPSIAIGFSEVKLVQDKVIYVGTALATIIAFAIVTIERFSIFQNLKKSVSCEAYIPCSQTFFSGINLKRALRQALTQKIVWT